MSVRERIHAIQRELLAGDATPARGREMLLELTALLGNVNAELREADAAYKVVLLGYLESSEKANRARIKAETSPEYRRMREAKDAQTLCTELARSLKTVIRSVDEEMRLSH